MNEKNVTDELNQVMTNAVLQLKKLVDSDMTQQHDFLSLVNVFLLGVVSTTADLVELHVPGSAPVIYADVEAAAKLGGLRAITTMQSSNGIAKYSVSGIEPDDMTAAMNYLGQELSTTLFKGMHELPIPLRKPETWLRGIEAMLATLLDQKFDNPHDVLDSLCDHVHMVLNDLSSRTRFN